MDKTKFTPGPWEVGEMRVGVSNSRPVVNTSKGAKTILTAEAYGCSQEEADANANLLAAAPDTYSELEAAFDQAMAQFKAGDRHATFNKQTVEAWGRALAKARGE